MNTGTKTRRMSLAAIFMALAVVACYLGSIWELVSISVVTFSGIITAAAVIECGIGYACLMYAGAAILGALLVPDKGVAILYATFFGYYPIVKSLVERLRARVLEIIIKVAIFLAVFTVYIFLLRAILFPELQTAASVLLYAGATVYLLIYDYALTALIGLYRRRVSKYFNRDRR